MEGTARVRKVYKDGKWFWGRSDCFSDSVWNGLDRGLARKIAINKCKSRPWYTCKPGPRLAHCFAVFSCNLRRRVMNSQSYDCIAEYITKISRLRGWSLQCFLKIQSLQPCMPFTKLYCCSTDNMYDVRFDFVSDVISEVTFDVMSDVWAEVMSDVISYVMSFVMSDVMSDWIEIPDLFREFLRNFPWACRVWVSWTREPNRFMFLQK